MADNKDKDEVVAYNQAVTNKPVVTDSVVTSDSNTNSTTTGTSHDRSTQSNYSTSKGETDRTTGLNLDQQVLDRYNQVIKNLGDDPRNSVAKAFLDTQPKPTPEQYEAQKAAAAKRAKLANLSESIRLLIDMGSGHAGGNVYKRDGVAQQVKEARKEADDADKAYADAVKEYNKNLYNANAEDAKFRRDLLTKFIETGRVEHGTTDNKQASSSNTATDRDSKQTTSGNTHSTQTTHHDYDDVYSTSEGGRYGTSSRGGGSGKSSGNVEVLVNRVDPKTGKAAQVRYPITKEHWTLVKQKARQQLNRDPQVLRNAALQFVQAPTGKVTKKQKQEFEAKVTEMENKIKTMLSLAKNDTAALESYDTKAVDEMLQTIIPLIPDADSTLRAGVINDYGRGDARVSETQHQGDRTTREQKSNNTTPKTGNGGYDYTKLFQ